MNLKLDENLGVCRHCRGAGVSACQSQPGTLIAALTQETITGKLWTVQRGRIRKYRPDRPEGEHEDA
jgi:hypothetical protein